MARRSAEPQLILGTAQLCSVYGVLDAGADTSGVTEAHRLLELAADLGFAAIDTAPAYGDAEDAIGSSGIALAVHTKLDPRLRPAESVARSRNRLRRDRIDVLYLHDPTEVLRPDGPVIAEAFGLVGSCVGNLGASVYEVEEFEAAVRDPRITVVQVPLNLLDQRFGDEILTRAADAGMFVHVRSVLLQGVLAAPPETLPTVVAGLRPYVEALHRITGEFGRTPMELALGWVRSRHAVAGVVVGAATAGDLQGIAASFRAPALSGGEVAALDQLRMPPRDISDPRRWSVGR